MIYIAWASDIAMYCSIIKTKKELPDHWPYITYLNTVNFAELYFQMKLLLRIRGLFWWWFVCFLFFSSLRVASGFFFSIGIDTKRGGLEKVAPLKLWWSWGIRYSCSISGCIFFTGVDHQEVILGKTPRGIHRETLVEFLHLLLSGDKPAAMWRWNYFR